MVNQRILPPTFPRYTKIKDRTLSMNFLEELAQRTKQACKIINCTIYHHALVRFCKFNFKQKNKKLAAVFFFINPGYYVYISRHFSWTSVKNRVLACCHVAYCNVCISRSPIPFLGQLLLRTCYANRRKRSVPHQSSLFEQQLHLM